jgi:hypothetical protein
MFFYSLWRHNQPAIYLTRDQRADLKTQNQYLAEVHKTILDNFLKKFEDQLINSPNGNAIKKKLSKNIKKFKEKIDTEYQEATSHNLPLKEAEVAKYIAKAEKIGAEQLKTNKALSVKVMSEVKAAIEPYLQSSIILNNVYEKVDSIRTPLQQLELPDEIKAQIKDEIYTLLGNIDWLKMKSDMNKEPVTFERLRDEIVNMQEKIITFIPADISLTESVRSLFDTVLLEIPKPKLKIATPTQTPENSPRSSIEE